MATAVVLESPTTPAIWPIAETPTTVVEDPETPKPAPERGPTARSGNNLAAAILLLAVEDYQHGTPVNHESARKFLFPEIPAAEDHLEAIVGLMNGIAIRNLRAALDRMRPHWDAARQLRKGN